MEGARRESRPVVATVLLPEERPRIDAAGEGLYRAVHQQEVGDIMRNGRHSDLAGVLISVGHCERHGSAVIGKLVRELPYLMTVGLLSEVTPRTPAVLLELGHYGVRKVIDVRLPNGWTDLRSCIRATFVDQIEATVLRDARNAAPQACEDWWLFLKELVRKSRTVTSVREFCGGIGVLPSTIMSRFFRAKLPAPKRYLATIRLVRAAYLLDNEGFSIANVANHLEYSSPQSFGRHVRTVMKMSAAEFRTRYTGDMMVAQFVDGLIRPYAMRLRDFSPVRGSERANEFRVSKPNTTLRCD
jgi:methylphosphotriester-DNA--protein-cysteine methyltransferase